MVANKAVNIEVVNGNRLLPMLHVEGKLKEQLSQSWKDALVVKRLGKQLGYNVMRTNGYRKRIFHGDFRVR